MSENIGKIGWIDKGGKVIVEPRGLAGGQFCVIEDPNGSTASMAVTSLPPSLHRMQVLPLNAVGIPPSMASI